MKNLKIGVRLAGGFGMVLLLMTALIVIGVLRLGQISDVTRKLVDSDWEKNEKINAIGSNARDNNRLTLEMFIAPDDAYLKHLNEQIDGHKKEIDAAVEYLDNNLYLQEAKMLLAKLKESRAAYTASFSKVEQLLNTGKKVEAAKLMTTETVPALTEFMDNVNQFDRLLKSVVVSDGADIKHTVDFTAKVMIGLGLAALLIGVTFALVITRSITRPMADAVRVAETVASGDLSGQIEVASTDETGQLMQALKNMNDSLLKIVNQVRTGTDTIATASNQIAAGNLDLSSRTEEQASALEETASSMEELTSTVKQNADNARQANQLAVSASGVAQKGGAVVSQVINTMGSINESAKKIVDIIGVIDSIAFQTNILALNAAVESARAGEQGRGFAVVASEVRNLAQRSAAAAKEIKLLINDSVERVDIGTKLVDQAGATMNEVVESVKRVTDIMEEISSASLEQTAGIEQINQAIMQMDEVTQQNAALVEEAAAAAQSLEVQSSNLVDVVSVFKTEGNRPAVSAPIKLVEAASQIKHAAEIPGLIASRKNKPQKITRKPLKRVENGMVAISSSADWEEF